MDQCTTLITKSPQQTTLMDFARTMETTKTFHSTSIALTVAPSQRIAQNSSMSPCPTKVHISSIEYASKHKLRHDKPFRCDFQGCSRREGFTTQNDLDRHKKSLHQIHSGKSYMCAAPHCAKKTKVWPRADNFRQHCQRLHKDQDLHELMDRSEKFFNATHGRAWY